MFYKCNIMEPDENYPFFLKALKHFVPEKKRDGMQKKLHYDAGISQSLLSMIISGKKPGSVRSHMKIANALGYSYDDFVSFGRSIETGNSPEPKPLRSSNNVHLFPKRKHPSTEKELVNEDMHKRLDTILNSGHRVLIAAIESNLIAFSESVEDKNERKAMMERIKKLEIKR